VAPLGREDGVPKWLREFIEGLLPWYNPTEEATRDTRTAYIAGRAAVAGTRAAKVIAEYRRAEARAGAAMEKVIDEVPK
jgi:hypothetical protein